MGKMYDRGEKKRWPKKKEKAEFRQDIGFQISKHFVKKDTEGYVCNKVYLCTCARSVCVYVQVEGKGGHIYLKVEKWKTKWEKKEKEKREMDDWIWQAVHRF